MEKLWETLFALLSAIALGAAKIISRNSKKAPPIGWVLGQLFVSGAAGLFIINGARIFGLTGDAIYFLAGAAGWGGSVIISLIYKKTLKETNLDEKSNDKNPKDKEEK